MFGPMNGPKLFREPSCVRMRFLTGWISHTLATIRAVPRRRNASLDFWRFVATLLIVCLHLHWKFPETRFECCYLIVDFFFILNGFFIAQAYEANCGLHPAVWVFQRVKKIFPTLLYSLLFLLLFKFISGTTNAALFLKDNVGVLYELFFFRLSALTDYYLNIPAWYLTPYILCGGLMVSMIRTKPQFTIFIFAPFCSLIGTCFLAKTFGQLGQGGQIVLGFIDAGLIRAASDMSIGILTFYLCKNTKEIKSVLLSSGIEIIIIYLVYLNLINSKPGPNDVFILPLFSALTFASYKAKGVIDAVFSNAIVAQLSKYSLPIFLCHPIAINYGDVLFGPYWNRTTCFISAIIFSILSYYAIHILTHFFISLSENKSQRLHY